jgi:hypothetical protein
LSFFPKALVVAGAVVALAAPAALAHSSFIYGPDLRVEGQSVKKSIAFTLRLTPSYSTPKPGVTVTMTNCKSGQRVPIHLIRHVGALGAGQSLKAHLGKIVWSLTSVPAKPAKPTLRLRLTAPKGVKTFCTVTSMYDQFTKKTVKITSRVPV